MRVLILGGTKFVGPHVVEHLVDLGHEVAIFHRGATETDLPLKVRHIHGDFGAFDDYVETLRALSPDVVVDMVPFREEDCRRIRMFKGFARRFVAVSSQDVYRAFGRIWRTEPGLPDTTPLTEDSPLREQLTTAGLAYNKTAVERGLVGDADFSGTILRLPATHGPRDSQHRLFEYLKRMDDGRSTILIDKARANWRWARGYVEDVAHAIVLAITNDRAANRIYNVAYPETLNEAEWVSEIARVLGWKGEVIAVPSERLPPALRSDALDLTQQYEVDSSSIRRELGYSEIVPFDEALRRTIEWERKNPPEPVDPKRFDYAAEDAVLLDLKERLNLP